MPPRRAQASVDPYGEDDTIVLPDGCIAEDVEIDFGYNHTNDAAEANHNANGTATQRPLTYGLDSTHMATISAAAKQRAISPSGHDDDELAGGESTPLSAEAVVESTKQRREARRKSSSINHPGKRTWWSYLPCFPSVPSIDERFGRKFTFGERLADRVSGAVGSWPFVCTQTVALFSWILFNVLFNGPDPFPFILLNLCLSFQAAYTGPIVMMSQNRQSDIDRDKAFDLHEKVDHIRLNQVWALWDQLQLQQKKLDTIQEGMEKIIDLVAMQQNMQNEMQNQINNAASAAAAQQPQPPPSSSQQPSRKISKESEADAVPAKQPSDDAPQPNGHRALPLSVSVGGGGGGDTSGPPTSAVAADSTVAASSSGSFLSPPASTVHAGAVSGSGSTGAVSPAAGGVGSSSPTVTTAVAVASSRDSDGPCTCLPPSMCDNCMSALERAEVTPAFLRRANPRFVPSAPSSFPTAEFVPASGHYSQPLDYRPALHQQQVQQQQTRRERERTHAAAASAGRAASTSPRRPLSATAAPADYHATPQAARRQQTDRQLSPDRERSLERITYIHPMPSAAPAPAPSSSGVAVAPSVARVHSTSDHRADGDIELAVSASAAREGITPGATDATEP